MSPASSLSWILLAALAVGCGKKEPTEKQPPDKPTKAVDAGTKRKTPYEKQIEDILALDAVVMKLQGEIEVAEKAGDFEKLAVLRDKHKAAVNALEQARERLAMMDVMLERKRREQQKKQQDQAPDGGVP